MSKFLTLEGEGNTRRRKMSLMDVCGLGAPRFLTPEEAAARQAAQSAAWTGSEASRDRVMYADEAAVIEAREKAKAEEVKTRPEMYTPFVPTGDSKSIFAAYGLKGVDTMEAGRLAVCMMAAEGTLSRPPDREEVEGLGQMALMSLCGLEPDWLNDEELGFWKRLRRAFTPPARLRKTLAKVKKVATRILPPKVTKFIQKGIRYAGATYGIGLSFVAPKQYNKMFGLSGKEAGFFKRASQALKTVGTAALTIVAPPLGAGLMAAELAQKAARGNWKGALMEAGMSIAGGAAGGAFLGKFAGKFAASGLGKAAGKFSGAGAKSLFSRVGASPGIAGKFSSFMTKSGGSFLGKSIAGRTGMALIKDKAKGMLMRVVKDKLGGFKMEKFNKEQIPEGDYEALPDGEPVPITVDEEVDGSLAAHIAGSSTLGPGEEINPALLNGSEGNPYPADAVQGQTTAQVEARLNPEDQGNFLTPSQEQEIIGAASKSELSDMIKERIDQARYAQPAPSRVMDSPEGMAGFMDDEEISLGEILRAGRRRIRQPAPRIGTPRRRMFRIR